jgi:hypothetical protein
MPPAASSPEGELLAGLIGADRLMIGALLRQAVASMLLIDYRASLELAALLEAAPASSWRWN